MQAQQVMYMEAQHPNTTKSMEDTNGPGHTMQSEVCPAAQHPRQKEKSESGKYMQNPTSYIMTFKARVARLSDAPSSIKWELSSFVRP
eukprot:CAMPEP_0172883598 /NCGR_PEP_ID=MMETSP1075-20121228/122992_1 /TAXON_ID=2916 /ORGANISM="Ceratium fusus, Strain PA161109" /LENGTH=87 /DNA_ID=CAMNT_0013736519 /DNA_START=246 /DNA_END=509 /DNA_ORIENTATION=+